MGIRGEKGKANCSISNSISLFFLFSGSSGGDRGGRQPTCYPPQPRPFCWVPRIAVCGGGDIFEMRGLHSLPDMLLCAEEAAQWKVAEEHRRHSLLVSVWKLPEALFFFAELPKFEWLIFNSTTGQSPKM